MAVTSVKNHDIMGLVRQINDYIYELAVSQSQGSRIVHPDDLARLKGYQVFAASYKAWIVAQPWLDLPATHPNEIVVPEPPSEMPEKNNCLTDVIVMYHKMREELLECTSAQMATGLAEPDADRFDKIHTKIDSYITEVIEKVQPVDKPEPTPVG